MAPKFWPAPSSPSLFLPLSPPVALSLGHKSVVVYENLQHCNATLRGSSAPHWSLLVIWHGAVNMNFLYIISFSRIEPHSFKSLCLPSNPFCNVKAFALPFLFVVGNAVLLFSCCLTRSARSSSLLMEPDGLDSLPGSSWRFGTLDGLSASLPDPGSVWICPGSSCQNRGSGRFAPAALVRPLPVTSPHTMRPERLTIR